MRGVDLDPFDDIVNVGWGGSVVLLTVSSAQETEVQVQDPFSSVKVPGDADLDPPDGFPGGRFPFATPQDIVRDDYKSLKIFGLQSFVTGSFVAKAAGPVTFTIWMGNASTGLDYFAGVDQHRSIGPFPEDRITLTAQPSFEFLQDHPTVPGYWKTGDIPFITEWFVEYGQQPAIKPPIFDQYFLLNFANMKRVRATVVGYDPANVGGDTRPPPAVVKFQKWNGGHFHISDRGQVTNVGGTLAFEDTRTAGSSAIDESFDLISTGFTVE